MRLNFHQSTQSLFFSSYYHVAVVETFLYGVIFKVVHSEARVACTNDHEWSLLVRANKIIYEPIVGWPMLQESFYSMYKPFRRTMNVMLLLTLRT